MIPKALYSNFDYRYNLDQLENLNLPLNFIATIKIQAQSVACLVNEHYLKKLEGGWGFSDDVPTLAQQQEEQFNNETAFGEKETFREEYAAGFGTAFLVDKQHVLTAAHCFCHEKSNKINTRLLDATRLVFGFHDVKEKRSDYFFKEGQVYRVTVVAHQFLQLPGRTTGFSEWTDWALIKLDREAPYPPLPLNMTEKAANNIELYMLGHPNGLPLKFTHKGAIKGNNENDFFDCNLDAFAGNSGSLVASKSTQQVEGILCAGTPKDYEITNNYRGTGQKRIQALCVTEKEINSSKVGERLENCQRVHVLRHLLHEGLLGLEGIERQENAPELIIEALKAGYKSRHTIPRLVGNALPIDEIYTELVLICNDKEKDKKDEEKAFEEHRINSWEDIHDSKESIALHTLFDRREGKAQKRLLILGRAGIGKSTLCQHIAHQWAEGKLWKEKFDAIFWIPLRKLQNIHSAETAASFLFRTCCQGNGQKLYVSDIADYLKNNSEKILFVLDGLDEVSIEDNSLQKGIVDELLKFPHWILTSRPHAAGHIQADAIIENVGFASKTIELYIQKSFPTTAEAIIQKIRQNPIIFGLCHIPINLELVCSILKKTKRDISSIHSMTSLYEELTLTLQRRFLEKIGRVNAWEWEIEDIEKDSELEKTFSLLENIAWEGLLERKLSFSFNCENMKKIYCESYPVSEVEKRKPLVIQICNSGFLQFTGDHEDILKNEYSFLHLTFQEFFAARYLVRLLQKNSSEASKYIKTVKFDPRYKVVMWFVAGLLKNEGGDFKNLNAFFDILDSPKDSIGFYTSLLKVRCLEECGLLNQHDQEIKFWCKQLAVNALLKPMWHHLVEAFEISPKAAEVYLIPELKICSLSSDRKIKKKAMHALKQITPQSTRIITASQHLDTMPKTTIQLTSSMLTKALEEENMSKVGWYIENALTRSDATKLLPLEVVTLALKNKNSFIREYVARALSKICQKNSESSFPLLIQALLDQDKSVGECAAKGLNKIVISQEHIHLLDKASQDPRQHVRRAAIVALMQTNQKKIEQALMDDDIYIRQEAVKALSKTDSSLTLLISALNDEEWRVRQEVIKALTIIRPTESKDVLELIAPKLQDSNKYVRKCAAAALKKYELSSYLETDTSLIYYFYGKEQRHSLFSNTSLSNLVKAYQKSSQSHFLSAIILKCVEENKAIFYQNNFLCFFEKETLCRVPLENLSESLIEKLVQEYPKFIFKLPPLQNNVTGSQESPQNTYTCSLQ